jgi:DNA-directed RNA polymerase specialized sigma24 family protein
MYCKIKSLGKVVLIVIFIVAAKIASAQSNFVENANNTPYPQKFDSIVNFLRPFEIFGGKDSVGLAAAIATLGQLTGSTLDRQKIEIQKQTGLLLPFWNKGDTALLYPKLNLLLAKAQNLGFTRGIIDIYHFKAKVANAAMDDIKAFKYFSLCKDYFFELTKAEQRNAMRYIYDIALEYYKYQDYENAIELAHLANNTNQTYQNILAENVIAKSYLRLGQYDSCIKWSTNALQYGVADKDFKNIWQGLNRGNIGIAYYMKGNCEKALPLLQHGLDSCKKYNVYDAATAFAAYLGMCAIKQNKLSEANSYLNWGESFLGKHNDVMSLVEFYDAKALYARKLGNASLILAAQDSLQYYKSIFDKKYDSNQKIKIEVENEKQILENQRLAKEQALRFQKWLRGGIIAFLFLACIIALLLFNREKLRYKLKSQQLEQEKYEAENALAIASHQLKDYTKSLQQKAALIEQFSQEIDLLQKKQTEKEASLENEQHLENLRRLTILTEDDWETFRNLFEKAHPGFFVRLKNKLPELNPAEVRFLALTKLKLSSKEMANMLGVSQEAIRSIKSRMKKRISPSDEQWDAETFADEV